LAAKGARWSSISLVISGYGGEQVGEHRQQPVAVAAELAALHLEIENGEKFPFDRRW